MNGLIKVAQMEKQALGLLRGATKAFDKNIFRVGQNLFRGQGSKVTRQGWDAYRKQNPALMYKALGYGVPGYGLYKGVEAAGGPLKDFGEGVLDFGGKVGEGIGNAVGAVGRNIGKLAGAGLPVLAFLASR